MSELRLESFYNLIESEDGITVRLKPETPTQKVLYIILSLLFAAPFAFVGTLGIIKGNAFFAVTCCVCLPLLLIWLVLGQKEWRKLQSIFSFSISESGVTITDFGGNHSILWQGACSYGVANCILARRPIGRTAALDFKAFFYVCKKEMDEKNLKKVLRFWNDKSSSTDEIIVLPFYLNTDKYEDYQVIMKYVYKYCDKSKERSYIEPII